MYLSKEITDNLRELDPTLVAPIEVWNAANERLKNESIETVTRTMGFDVKDYDRMLVAGQILMINLCNNTPSNVHAYIERTDDSLNNETIGFLNKFKNEIDGLLILFDWTNYRYDYLSANSMIKLYLSKLQYMGKPFEKPSTMFMRICAQIYHDKTFEEFRDAFVPMALGKYTVASAALLNAGFHNPQMASCFTTVIGDTRLDIYSGLARVGEISAGKGGMGLTVTPIRHSEIKGNGMSKGLVPMCRQYDNIIDYSKQGRARNGAMTLFVSPWHIDIREFIQSLDESVGKHENHLSHTDICVWMPWIFWDRVKEEDGKWTLFCPKYAPKLLALHGHEFSKQYELYENDDTIPSRFKVTILARDLLRLISKMWQKKGKPFIMNGDSANFKSNHKHIGYIPGSNLCLEIVEYIDEETINVCNLTSLSLSSFAKLSKETKTWNDVIENYDFEGFAHTVRIVVKNLNNMIDVNYSPLSALYNHWAKITTGEALKDRLRDPILNANDKYRALGIGVQGLSTMFQKLDLSYMDPFARKLDETIFACLYFNAIAASIQEAIYNGVCKAHIGSPASSGKFQFDLWKEEWEVRWKGKGCHTVPTADAFTPVNPSDWGQKNITLIGEYGEVYVIEPSWNSLREAMILYGMRNSLLLALMPTMSSAKPLRNSETVELHPSNIYSADVVYGSYPVVNYLMVKDFKELNLWDDRIVNHIIVNDGHIDKVAEFLVQTGKIEADSDVHRRVLHLQEKYIGMMRLRPTFVKESSFRRNKYICQSSSSNVCIEDATIEKLESLFMIDGEYGNKTVQYYLYQRSQVRNVTLAEVEKIQPMCTDGLCCTA